MKMTDTISGFIPAALPHPRRDPRWPFTQPTHTFPFVNAPRNHVMNESVPHASS